MRFQVYGDFGGGAVLIGWPRKSLSAAMSFAQRVSRGGVYSNLRAVSTRGRVWPYKMGA